MGRLKLLGEHEVGGAAVAILEGDTSIVAQATAVSFAPADFLVEDAGDGRANVALDYANSAMALADKSRPSPWVGAGDLAARSIADLGTKDHDLLSGLGDDDHPQYILASGGRAFAGNQSMGGNRLTMLGAPLMSTDATPKGLVDQKIDIVDAVRRDGTQAFTGDQSMGTHKLTDVVDPTNPQDAATKAYADTHGPGGAGVPPLHRHQRVGYYMRPYAAGSLYGTYQIPADELWAAAFVVPETATFDRIAVYVTTPSSQAPNQMRLGIYDDDGNSAPDALVLDAGVVDTSTSGLKTITIDEQLGAGIYWLVAIQGGNCRIRVGSYGIHLHIDASNFYRACAGWQGSQSFGALPASFPAPISLTWQIPALGIALRVGSVP
jgi:hypothetical protein